MILAIIIRAVLVIIAFVSVGTIVHASTASDFSKIWSERDKTYRAERSSLEETALQKATVLVTAINNNGDVGSSDIISALIAARQLSELYGKGTFLYEFREHMKTKPSVWVSEAWMQEKVSELKTRSIAADDFESQVRAMQPGKNVSFHDWIRATEKLVMMRGELNGRVQEMTLVDQNLGSFYQAKRQADEKRRDFLRAFGQALASQQNAVQNWSASCTTFGRTTNCTGN